MIRRPAGIYDTKYEQSISIVRTRTQWGILIGSIILLFCLPSLLPISLLTTLNIFGITLISVLGLNILTGLCGQLSIGQAAFMGVGGYLSGILTAYAGFPFWVALLCGALGSGLISSFFGLPSIRIKGFYLLMSTLAAHFILVWCFAHIRPDMLGGHDGFAIPLAKGGGMLFKTQQGTYYLTMALVVVMTFFAKNFTRTKTGRAFIAIRDNDLAAQAMGIRLPAYKLLAFFICGVYAGVAGALYVHYQRFAAYEQFPLMDAVWYMGIMIIGGMGSTAGCYFGTIFVTGLDRLFLNISGPLVSVFPTVFGLRGEVFFAGMSQVLFGAILILFIIFEPRGLSHRWEMIKATYRLWPFAYT